MQRPIFFAYGVGCHLLFLGTFAYMAGFVGNLRGFKTIDTTVDGPVGAALAINMALLGLFAVQHSVMARPSFKRVWTRVVPNPIERSTYVLASNAVVILLMWQWRGIDTVVWDVQHPALRAAVWGLFAVGWLLVPGVTLLIDHFDLFGTRQVWLHLRGREYKPLPFRVPLFYKHVRHPLYVGWTIAFWATPTMTVGHLLFASVLTGYMGLAVLFEERNLVDHFGRQYQDYQRQVPMFVPRLRAAVPVFPTAYEAEPATQPADSVPYHHVSDRSEADASWKRSPYASRNFRDRSTTSTQTRG
jgi:protein-S-isoprenylcysteine O-methyltransferase Ste14